MADLVSKTIVISLGNGSLQTGFSTVTARFLTSNNALLEQVQGSLPAAPDIIVLYKRWQALYHGLASRFAVSVERQSSFRSLDISDDELEIDEAGVTHVSQSTFDDLCQDLKQALNSWLNTQEFLRIEQRIRSVTTHVEEVRLILETQDPQVLRLPWHQWQLLQDYLQNRMNLGT